MAVKKGGLGKGLDSLIPSGAPKNKKNITEEKKQQVREVEEEVDCWFRKRMITMKLLPGNADGELQNWQG